ncbi:MAG TPA: prenyltransferase/squalene oxidase repeat-containing protein [Planctomycetota bacterium]|nr:prenyltransferase/squalene oxidase repeat-containing protein [Planctomycetota bacterium]
MFRASVLRAVSIWAAFSSFAVLPAQQSRPALPVGPAGTAPAPGAASMLATERYLFVVYGGVLHQYDIDTLALRNKVRLDAAPIAAREVGVAPALVVEPPAATVAARATGMREVVDRAIDWLVRHQDEDGKWDADGFMKHDVEGDVCDGPGNAVHDVGVTGLAALALLADGNTLRAGPHMQSLRRAIIWLKAQQQDNGLFGAPASHDFIYDHAIATYAVCEAFGLSKYKALQVVAQNGINYLEGHRNPYSVWRYQPRDNDNDSSVTAWCLLACAAGDGFGLQVNKTALDLGAVWFDQVTDPTGRAGYSKQGELSSRQPGDHARRFPPENGEAITAAALLCRHVLGQSPGTKPIMKASANLLSAKPPIWQPDAGTIDEYYWYFAARALQRSGGRIWTDWSRRLGVALASSQRVDGTRAGSWDPIGVWGEAGGRVYSTAMLVMAAQATLPEAQSATR